MTASICAFCGGPGPLKDSHVLPAFLFRWLRAYSVTGHMRNSDTPNRRVQDGVKKPWLCDTCEQNFSRYETAFAGKLFHPWLKGNRRVRYDAWLLKFCVSVSWRVLKHCHGHNPNARYTADQLALLGEAEATWGAFLKGDVPHPGKFEQHLVIWDLIEETNILNMPPNINRFLMGAITMDIIGGTRSMMTFAKMGRFMLFGIIQKGSNTWGGTKIYANEGWIEAGKKELPGVLKGFILDRAAMTADHYSAMSDVQHDKMEADAMRDIDRFANSDQFAAMMADADLFGTQAIIRNRKPT
jgi:hypothetical protein